MRFFRGVGLLALMSEPSTILAQDEMQEILEAAGDTLCYAVARAATIPADDDPADEVRRSIKRALRCVEAASAATGSTVSVKGYAANALARLRSSLQLLQEMDYVDEKIRLTMRATARAISLIYPLTQSEGPLHLVPRKSASRRRRTVTSRRLSRPHPVFNVTVGGETRFFTGFVGDIASGGLFIATYNIYPLATKITLSAELGRDRVIMGTARVAWVREHNPGIPEISPGMGVVFQNLTRAAENEINRYLLDHESLFYEAV